MAANGMASPKAVCDQGVILADKSEHKSSSRAPGTAAVCYSGQAMVTVMFYGTTTELGLDLKVGYRRRRSVDHWTCPARRAGAMGRADLHAARLGPGGKRGSTVTFR